MWSAPSSSGTIHNLLHRPKRLAKPEMAPQSRAISHVEWINKWIIDETSCATLRVHIKLRKGPDPKGQTEGTATIAWIRYFSCWFHLGGQEMLPRGCKQSPIPQLKGWNRLLSFPQYTLCVLKLWKARNGFATKSDVLLLRAVINWRATRRSSKFNLSAPLPSSVEY